MDSRYNNYNTYNNGNPNNQQQQQQLPSGGMSRDASPATQRHANQEYVYRSNDHGRHEQGRIHSPTSGPDMQQQHQQQLQEQQQHTSMYDVDHRQVMSELRNVMQRRAPSSPERLTTIPEVIQPPPSVITTGLRDSVPAGIREVPPNSYLSVSPSRGRRSNSPDNQSPLRQSVPTNWDHRPEDEEDRYSDCSGPRTGYDVQSMQGSIHRMPYDNHPSALSPYNEGPSMDAFPRGQYDGPAVNGSMRSPYDARSVSPGGPRSPVESIHSGFTFSHSRNPSQDRMSTRSSVAPSDAPGSVYSGVGSQRRERTMTPTRSSLATAMFGALDMSSDAVELAPLSASSSLPSKVQVDINAMPRVSLAGFTPDTLGPVGSPLHGDGMTSSMANPSLPPPLVESSLLRRISTRFFGGPGGSNDEEGGLQRKRTMIRPERARRPRHDLLTEGGMTEILNAKEAAKRTAKPGREWTAWLMFASCVTCYAPNFLLKCCGMKNPKVRTAWREKMGLISVILFTCLFLIFVTFGVQSLACRSRIIDDKFNTKWFNASTVMIRGDVYDIKKFKHPGQLTNIKLVAGRDISWLFPVDPATLPGGVSACLTVPDATTFRAPCTVDNVNDIRGYCHSPEEFTAMRDKIRKVGTIRFGWPQVRKGNKYIVYNGEVLNLDRYFKEGTNFLGGPEFDQLLIDNLGKDTTHIFARTTVMKKKMDCLVENFKVGVLETERMECFMGQVGASVTLRWMLHLFRHSCTSP